MTDRKIEMVIIHCSDSPEGDVHSIREFHMRPKSEGGRGFDDIGYHFVILKDGTVQDGRSIEKVGAHCEGHNATSIGVCLVGKPDMQRPSVDFTDSQMRALKILVHQILRSCGLDEDNVFGHYELDQCGKVCPQMPGPLLRAYIGERL